MATLKKLLEIKDKKKLIEVKKILDTFFYKAGINIGFYNLETSKQYKKFNTDLSKAIRKQILNVAKVENVKAVVDRVPVTQKLDMSKDVIYDTIIAAVMISLADEVVADEIDNFLLTASNMGGQVALDRAGLSLDFDLTNPQIIAGLEDRTKYIINVVDNTTKKWLINTIVKASNDGKTPEQIVRLLADESRKVAEARALKITETEATKAMGDTEYQMLLRNGVLTKRWIVVGDEKTCPICMGNERQGDIPIQEAFPSGELSTPAHIMCRCYLDFGEWGTSEDQTWLGE